MEPVIFWIIVAFLFFACLSIVWVKMEDIKKSINEKKDQQTSEILHEKRNPTPQYHQP